jgi:hypothetical protein
VDFNGADLVNCYLGGSACVDLNGVNPI